jgi:hypothetical protein
MRTVSVLVGAVVALAGCSSSGGEADLGESGSPPSGSPTGQSPTGPEAPPITDPLDADAFLDDPCELTPLAELSGLGYAEPGEPKTEDDVARELSGPSCHWSGAEAGVGMTVQIQTVNRDNGIGGIAGLHEAAANGQLGFLEQTDDLSGYPAYFAGLSDRRSTGSCGLAVGIADDLNFTVTSLGYQGADDSCGNSVAVAEIVIDTLKANA